MCVIAATTSAGLGPFSTSVTVITLEDGKYCVLVVNDALICNLHSAAPSTPPAQFEASDISPTSAFLTWSPPSYDEQNGIIVLYVINVTVVNMGERFQLTSETNFLEVTTLRPFSTYLCVIAAATSVGLGPFSTSVTVETPEDGEWHWFRNVTSTVLICFVHAYLSKDRS